MAEAHEESRSPPGPAKSAVKIPLCKNEDLAEGDERGHSEKQDFESSGVQRHCLGSFKVCPTKCKCRADGDLTRLTLN